MKTVIRYIIGGFSLLLIGAVLIGVTFLQSYTKDYQYSEDYPIKIFSYVVAGKDQQHYYEYGSLAQSQGNNRCGYISKYDHKGDMIKYVLIDNDSKIQNIMSETTFIYEKDSDLFVIVSTITLTAEGTQDVASSIVRLNEDDLSTISRIKLDSQLSNMGVFDADKTGFWFSNIHATDNVIKIMKSDFDGNILSFSEITNQISLDLLDRDYILSSDPMAKGIEDKAIIINQKMKLHKDKIYFCGTIALHGSYESKYTGVVMCFDRSGNIIWRNDKTPMYFESQRIEPISRYNDIYIYNKKILVVGANGKYGAASDLSNKQKGTVLTPIIDEYNLNGDLIISKSFGNENKSSGFEKILKTNDGFLLLGRPRLGNIISGTSVHQKRELNGLKLDVFIDENVGFYTQLVDNKIIGRVTDFNTLMPSFKVFSDYQRFLRTKSLLSHLRWVQNYQIRIIVVFSIITVFCFFPLVKLLFLYRKKKEADPT
ncbi:MAG: hypothetical protein PHI32_06690 [Dysgonamonadaceae bacterium]|nr:hypothetical protein [Dysgonamonadaceae bacterium]